MTPRIAFVTTCRGRAQHLKETLPRNLFDNLDYPNCVFVILDYNSQDDLAAYVGNLFPMRIQEGKVVYYKSPEPDSFHMAHAKNMAHRCGLLEGADILVNLDADNLTTPGFARYIAEQWERAGGKRIFLWSRMIQGQFRRGISGRIAVTADAFLLAGGYNEKYCHWGPDDKDFNIRLQRLGFEPVEIAPQYLEALSHNDKMRFREYPAASAQKHHYHHFHVDDSAEAISNYGNFGCGTVYRNCGLDLIHLLPLPTRIFGIGMHKTATTSLHLALEELGYDSNHWESAKWAKNIWREMTSTGHSPTLEMSYAVCDLPIQLLYRKIDVAYPGSKFILTMTDEDAWIKAVELHWDAKHNPYRGGWDNDPFTNRVHAILYGRTDFNRDTFLARYRHHNADVIDYFRDRPGDLLVMNMSELTSRQCWEKLCGFLDKPVPSKPYPHGNSDAVLANRHWIHGGDL